MSIVKSSASKATTTKANAADNDKVDRCVSIIETTYCSANSPNDIPRQWWSGPTGQKEKDAACLRVFGTLPDHRKREPVVTETDRTTTAIHKANRLEDIVLTQGEEIKALGKSMSELIAAIGNGTAGSQTTSAKQARGDKQTPASVDIRLDIDYTKGGSPKLMLVPVNNSGMPVKWACTISQLHAIAIVNEGDEGKEALWEALHDVASRPDRK